MSNIEGLFARYTKDIGCLDDHIGLSPSRVRELLTGCYPEPLPKERKAVPYVPKPIEKPRPSKYMKLKGRNINGGKVPFRLTTVGKELTGLKVGEDTIIDRFYATNASRLGATQGKYFKIRRHKTLTGYTVVKRIS